jgi:hypothetical protein
VSLLA